mmetsp:Transcript_46317/g.88394  ORF Transcript_46317/g.88394 Transcript_46317/m.88394 type:complete len:434 (-) Transcript_46317:2021-3322(-)
MAELQLLFDRLRKHADEIMNANGDADALKQSISAGTHAVMAVKMHSREELEAVQEIKDSTSALKSQLAHAQLQLQSLHYQKTYFIKEINSCKEFRSKYSDDQLDLESEEEFKATMKSKGVDLPEAAHEIMLNRLAHEYEERKELCATLEELKSKRKILADVVSNKQKLLQGLGTHLVDLRKASLPLQQHLHLPFTHQAKQKKLAKLLPVPLYILYSQLLAVEEAFEDPLEISILGHASEVIAFNLREARAAEDRQAREHALSSRREEEEEEEEDRRTSKRSRVEKSKDSTNLKEAHPLSIKLHLPDVMLHVVFEFLPTLRVVCAEGRVGDVPHETILVNLFPGDAGITSPNTANALICQALTFEGTTNRPFLWAQHLAGLDFLPLLPPAKDCTAESVDDAVVVQGLQEHRQQQRVQSVLRAIRMRCQAGAELK